MTESEPPQHDFQRILPGIPVQVGVREHFGKPVPPSVPFAVVLILINEKSFLQAMQGGG